MGAQEQHDMHVRDLMRTRFPLRGDNWRKTARLVRPRWGKPSGQHDAPYGRVLTGGPAGTETAQLFVYDAMEDDRPAILIVDDIEAARDYVRVLSAYIAHVEKGEQE